MIKQHVHIKEYDWDVYAYFAVSEYHVSEIMDRLWDLGCDSSTALKAYENLSSGELDTGLCYSNYGRRQSVMVVALTTSAAQFANSLHHELVHLQSHIAQVFHLDPTGEQVAYLSGELIMKLFPRIKHLLCDCCRQEYEYEYE